MKVTFCVYDKPDHVGGPVTWIVRLLPALRALGVEANCLFLLHWGDSGPALDALRGQGFDCKAVLCHDRTEDRVRWILEQLRENPPDVFVPNLVVAGYFAGRWARAAGIPTVGVVHSDDEFYHALQDEFVSGPETFRVSGLVPVSRELERQIASRAPANTVVRRIPCGAPVPSQTVRRKPDALRIAYVGRLADEQKRISELARAFCRVVRDVPRTEAVIYGDGPQAAHVAEIVACDGAGLPVHLGGTIDSDKVQEQLLECDVIVLLSDYEGLPIALMEAMACGCVPVCLRTRSGIPELVEDGVTGLLVDNRDDDFTAAIRRLRDDRELLERLSSAARASIALSYENEKCAKDWAALLRELKGGAKPRRRVPVPARIELLPLNPLLESAELRRPLPTLAQKVYRNGRMLAGRVKRVILP